MYLNVSLEYETNWLVCWLDMLLWTTQIIWLEETPHTCPDSNKRNNSLKVNLRIRSQFSFIQSLCWEDFHEISGINSSNHDMIRSKSNNSQNLNSNLNKILKDGNWKQTNSLLKEFKNTPKIKQNQFTWACDEAHRARTCLLALKSAFFPFWEIEDLFFSFMPEEIEYFLSTIWFWDFVLHFQTGLNILKILWKWID